MKEEKKAAAAAAVEANMCSAFACVTGGRLHNQTADVGRSSQPRRGMPMPRVAEYTFLSHP